MHLKEWSGFFLVASEAEKMLKLRRTGDQILYLGLFKEAKTPRNNEGNRVSFMTFQRETSGKNKICSTA